MRSDFLLRSDTRSSSATASIAACTEAGGPLMSSALASIISVSVTCEPPPNSARTWAATRPGSLTSSGMATNTGRSPEGTSGSARAVIRRGGSAASSPPGRKRSTPSSSTMRTW